MTARSSFAPRGPRALLWVVLGLVLTAVLAGCAGTSAPPAGAQESYTDSDVPEARKRATNRMRLAVLYFQDGKLDIALDEVKQAIAVDPGWFEGYNMRGLIFMRMGDFLAAEASFQKALSINPASPDVRHNYGVTLCREGKHAEGIRMFATALNTPGYPRRANTLVEQGVCQQASAQLAAAEQSFMRAYEIDPSNPQAALQLGLLAFQRGDLPRAQFYTRRINNGDFASAESLWLGVKVERRLQNRDAQNQLGNELSKRFPQSREALALQRGAFDE